MFSFGKLAGKKHFLALFSSAEFGVIRSGDDAVRSGYDTDPPRAAPGVIHVRPLCGRLPGLFIPGKILLLQFIVCSRQRRNLLPILMQIQLP